MGPFGAVGEEAQVVLAEGGVVGEGGEIDQFGPGRVEGALDLPRLGDAREGDDRPLGRGRGGLEPVRYNDWEVKGLASDF